mgnify:CR=1 FL=1
MRICRIGYRENLQGVYTQRSNWSIQKEEVLRQEKLLCLENYSRSLYISGDFEIEGNQAILNNKEHDKSALVQDVALYNAFYNEIVMKENTEAK